MRTMQLNTRKPSIGHKSRSIDKLTNNPLDILSGHFLGSRPNKTSDQAFEIAISNLDGHGAGRERRCEDAAVACNAEGLPTWMADLGDGWRAVFLACVGVFLPLSD